ncbi:MATE family efflux transporter [Streptobacillus moniliformis]|uniref:Multidrug-efflux transporter n=1 Tax=Streptobacillus moniliformis (strain ATCC 14647 / DSM 12112 / NCTC 10651 / 9901) TaxID=519441 RepID=D1AXI8_STRM9|nr:MATE family efflux transporter [Streptobacillus moniliformis]ACZ01014.1 MATE efflux family protein [Streptobacillus moniliformis DSM 12112]AVL42614.1 MATE family efflux transporter [Streptobacillus moniliformis]SQA13847.1 Multidrug export protein mepA [Streptobacillus moniliformis]
MRGRLNLVEGSIGINLFRLAFPIILTSLMSILYNLTDIKFISYYLGDDAVSSATAASFYIGLSYSLLFITKNSVQIYVAQSIGANRKNSAKRYARVSLIISVVFSISYGLFTYIFAEQLIRLVGVKSPHYLYPAIDFLRISTFGFIFLFLSQNLSAIINGQGDTLGPFVFLSSGVILNIFLDYLFLGIFRFGIKGAAIATVFSQLISVILLFMYLKRKNSIFRNMKFFKLDEIKFYRKIIRLGLPSGISQGLFTLISIIIAKMIADVDESILGVQRLGIQFESFSWNIAGGFAAAVATFVGHNYGAGKYDRILKIYKVSVISISGFCLVLTGIFVFFARPLYSMFFIDTRLIEEGVKYLTIIGLAQVPQGIEIITTGAFNGVGKTKEPNIIGIVGTSLRIPIIMITLPTFGLLAIWWTIHFSMVFKGIISALIFIITWKKQLEYMKITLEI